MKIKLRHNISEYVPANYSIKIYEIPYNNIYTGNPQYFIHPRFSLTDKIRILGQYNINVSDFKPNDIIKFNIDKLTYYYIIHMLRIFKIESKYQINMVYSIYNLYYDWTHFKYER